MQTIAGHWQHFMAGCYGSIENKSPEPPVGVATATADGIEYVCAAQVSGFGELPQGCVKLTLKPAMYAVFAHDAHISELGQTYEAIWNDWFPNNGRVPAEAPNLERHNKSFDPRSGNGGVTIWIPIRN
jgi:AraC family transcriptional regulator